METLEELSQHDPTINFSQLLLPALKFLSGILLGTRKAQFLFVSLLSIGGIFPLIFPNYRILRVIIIIICDVLPLTFMGLGVNKIAKGSLENRMPAFKSAQAILLQRLEKDRAKRVKDKYDIYYPPPSSSSSSSDNAKTAPMGIVFYPGALVSLTAYASVASQLSDLGIIVVVMSTEPYRLQLLETLESIQEKTQNIIKKVVPEEEGYNVSEWTLAGHSLGAGMVVVLFDKFPTKMKALNITKAVFYGFASGRDLAGKSIRDSGLKVLIVNASEDTPFKNIKEEDKERLDTILPPSTTFKVIEGGNHAGYGHYGPQTYPFKDGDRSITLEEQQRIAVEMTSDFILESKETKKDA